MDFKIGFGKQCITPPEGIELCGYGYFLERRNTGVIEDLYARVIAIQTNGVCAVLFNADLIGLTDALCTKLERTISENYHVNPRFIMIASTHTHTGPMTGRLCGCGEFNTEFYQSLFDKFMLAVDAAFSDLKPVLKVTSNEGAFSDGIGKNRVVEGGEVDDTLRAVFFERDGAQPVALINHSCHPVSFGPGTKVSSDYPGVLCRLYGENGIDALYLNGFCGNINPIEKLMEGCADRAGEKLYLKSKELIESGNALEIADINACGDFLPIDLLPLTIDRVEQEYKEALKENSETYSRVMSIWSYTQKLRLVGDNPKTDPMQYKALRLGKLLIIYHSGETAIEFGKLLQKSFPNHIVMFVGNAFATMRYVPTEKMISAGGYEAFSSSFAYNCMPIDLGSGERYFNNLIAQVKKITN